MRYYTLAIVCLLMCNITYAQQPAKATASAPNTENIYEIKKQFLNNVLHNPADKDKGDNDNDLTRFNRWFSFVEPRCYPSGNLPRPDVLLNESRKQNNSARHAFRTTSGVTPWTSVGPVDPLSGFGIGRIDCIVIDPLDTATIYLGAACGGVWISHDAGTTWTSHSDNFPSLSVADIAVNPHHTDTLYAATGDGYGYVVPGSGSSSWLFWGGLYSAGVMKSTDGGATWTATGFSYLQSDQDIIQKLLIHPNNPNVLLAATTNGVYRTADAGATWTLVDAGHTFSMAFHPFQPDTVYSIHNTDLHVSYDAGLTWSTLYPSIGSGDRCTIAVSNAAPNNVWVLDDGNNLSVSVDGGNTFTMATSPSSTASFYGYYDRVLAVSPVDPNYVLAFGMNMAVSTSAGSVWNSMDPTSSVHPDNHAVAFNPLHPATIYDGNDGGIFVTRDGGASWTNISNGLTISQIYRMSSSRQTPAIMLCGLQDNASAYNDGITGWTMSNGPFGDGMDNAIHPLNDFIQIASTQYGNFEISYDQGVTYNLIATTGLNGSWTSPVAFNPHNADTIYFGLGDVYASYDMGVTVNNISSMSLFPGGATSLALAPSNSAVLYASDNSNVYITTDFGATWTNVTGTLPASSQAITGLVVDYKNPMLVYATLSGYTAGTKVFVSTTGGTTWTNISTGLPNVPADCIAVDSSTPGALFVGTDMGIYYTDSSTSGWSAYSTGLPNVIVDDIDINYTNYKIRVATYGRGIWEAGLPHLPPLKVSTPAIAVRPQLYPNPTHSTWKVVFGKQKPADFCIKVSDISGRIIQTQDNSDIIDASKLVSGLYNIEVTAGNDHYNLKAVKN